MTGTEVQLYGGPLDGMAIKMSDERAVLRLPVLADITRFLAAQKRGEDAKAAEYEYVRDARGRYIFHDLVERLG